MSSVRHFQTPTTNSGLLEGEEFISYKTNDETWFSNGSISQKNELEVEDRISHYYQYLDTVRSRALSPATQQCAYVCRISNLSFFIHSWRSETPLLIDKPINPSVLSIVQFGVADSAVVLFSIQIGNGFFGCYWVRRCTKRGGQSVEVQFMSITMIVLSVSKWSWGRV